MSMVQRIRELVVQASNGSNTDDDRVKIHLEMSNLLSEIDNIAKENPFN